MRRWGTNREEGRSFCPDSRGVRLRGKGSGVLRFLAIATALMLPSVMGMHAVAAGPAIRVLAVMKPTMTIGAPHTGVVAPDAGHNVLYATGGSVSGAAVSTVNALNASTGDVVASLHLAGVDPEALAYDPAAGRIVVAADHLTVSARAPSSAVAMLYVLNRQPLRVMRAISLGHATGPMLMTVNDVVLTRGRAYVLTGGGQVLEVDLAAGTVRQFASLAQEGATDVGGMLAIDPAAERLVVVSGAAVGLYDLKTGMELRRLTGTGAQEVGIDRVRHLVAVPDAHAGIDFLDERTGAAVRVVDTLGAGLVPISSITVDPVHGTAVAVAQVSGKTDTNTCCQDLVTVDEETGRIVARHAVTGQVQTLSVDGGHVFAESYPSNVLTEASTVTGRILGRYRFYPTTYSDYPAGFALDAASHRVFLVGWGKQWVIDSGE